MCCWDSSRITSTTSLRDPAAKRLVPRRVGRCDYVDPVTTAALATATFIRELTLGHLLATTRVDATGADVEAHPEEASCT